MSLHSYRCGWQIRDRRRTPAPRPVGPRRGAAPQRRWAPRRPTPLAPHHPTHARATSPASTHCTAFPISHSASPPRSIRCTPRPRPHMDSSRRSAPGSWHIAAYCAKRWAHRSKRRPYRNSSASPRPIPAVSPISSHTAEPRSAMGEKAHP